jgi:hypothetical protein
MKMNIQNLYFQFIYVTKSVLISLEIPGLSQKWTGISQKMNQDQPKNEPGSAKK